MKVIVDGIVLERSDDLAIISEDDEVAQAAEDETVKEVSTVDATGDE